MTKRFTLKYEKIGKYFSMGIVDHETNEPFDDTTYEFNQCSFNDSKDEMEDLCLLLNELAEENKDLHQKEVELGQNYLRLLEENEELKKEVESKERLIKAYDQWAYDLKNDGVLDD